MTDTQNDLLAASPLFAAEAERAEQIRKKVLADELFRRRQRLAVGDAAHAQHQATKQRRKHLELLVAQLAALRQQGEREHGMTRFGRPVLVKELPEYQRNLQRAESAAKRCEAEIAHEEAKLAELQRLDHQAGHGG
jgi:hypothetical protein